VRAGLRDPFVRILELGDFSVSYQIAGFLQEVKKLVATKSLLNADESDTLKKKLKKVEGDPERKALESGLARLQSNKQARCFKVVEGGGNSVPLPGTASLCRGRNPLAESPPGFETVPRDQLQPPSI
jgi:hypothetical protein